MTEKSENRVKSLFGADYREVEVGDIVTLAQDTPLQLENGAEISSFPVAFQTYGRLNADKSNAILVCHGLTADQYLIGKHPVTGKPGWWENAVGKGKTIDTDKYFIICPNSLGGCMGSYGPKSADKNGQPYNLDFPVFTIRDTVRVHKLLLENLGINRLFSVIGGSMGGMQVLEWMASYPGMLHSAVPISTAPRHTAQNIAFHEIGRQAIMADPGWCGGNYIKERKFPSGGLSVARMTAHVTYLSKEGLHRKFGRELQDRDRVSYGFDADFQIESYLRHQGMAFVERFDPNSYLYLTRAMDYFDLAADYGGELHNAFRRSADVSCCIISFSSDWLFPTEGMKQIVHALSGVAADVSFVEIESDKGHDAFLLDEPELNQTLNGFLGRVERKLSRNV